MTKRLVYQPKTTCLIMRDSALKGKKPSDIGDIDEFLIDVSDDIVSGTVNRRLNAMSDISLVLQNKNGRYTKKNRNFIEPMDRIILRMSRVGTPFLVFSGFVDDAPYYQMYPGTVTITASDTLKLLHNTYFDPGLLYMQQWFIAHGWSYNAATGALTKPGGGTDGGGLGNDDLYGNMHDLIFAMLTEIANWPDSAISIYDLPKKFINSITTLFTDVTTDSQQAYDESAALLNRLYGGIGLLAPPPGTTGGSTTPGATGSGGTSSGNTTAKQIADAAIGAGFIAEAAVTAVAVALAESGGLTNAMNWNPDNATSGGGTWDSGLWQINSQHASPPGNHLPGNPEDSLAGYQATKHLYPFTATSYIENCWDVTFNAAQAYSISNHGTTFTPWATYNNQAYKDHLSEAQEAVNGASSDPGSSPDDNPDPVDNRGALDKSVADKVIQIALSQVGVKETSYNSGPQIDKYLALCGQSPGQPWCVAFVQWCFDQAGRPIKESSFTAATEQMASTAKRLGWNVSSPQPADIILYSDRHTALVIAANGNQIKTVDGNSGSATDAVVVKDWFTVPTDEAIVLMRVPGVGTSTIGYTGGPQPTPVVPGTASAAGLTIEQIAALGAQGAFYTQQFQASDSTLSNSLSGQRALSNDIPIINWIDQAVQSSGRVYCSMPNGSFLSFFADRWGFFDRTPYWYINDIEIIDLTINKNDTNLVTHVFTSGPNVPDAGITLYNRMTSMIASVEDQGFKYFISGNDSRAPSFDPVEFLARYGARPYVNDLENINHPMLLWMHGWMKFLEFWSKRYTATASFTFMPELFPGGLVSFGNRVQMFIEGVTHSFDIGGGFTTTAELSSIRGLSIDLDTPDPLFRAPGD